MPFAVESDRVRVEASYLSIVPRTLNVVAADDGGGSATGGGIWEAHPTPDTVVADSNTTMIFLFMTDPASPGKPGTPDATSRAVPVDAGAQHVPQRVESQHIAPLSTELNPTP